MKFVNLDFNASCKKVVIKSMVKGGECTKDWWGPSSCLIDQVDMDPGISPYLAVSRFTCMISRHLMRNFLALMRAWCTGWSIGLLLQLICEDEVIFFAEKRYVYG